MTTKIAVSLPDDLVVAAKAAVASGHAASVSAYVAEAMRRLHDESALAQLVAELVAEHCEPDVEDVRWADSVIAAAYTGVEHG